MLDMRNQAGQNGVLEPILLLEGTEYRYQFLGSGGDVWETDHPDVFVADDAFGSGGRLRTGLFTGSMRIRIYSAGVECGQVAFEVRSRKLDYLSHYRRMLGDIAEVATEVIMQHFAPAAAAFVPADSGDPKTLYQRCAFLRSLLEQPEFEAAIGQILARPYETWEPEVIARPTSQGAKANRSVQRQLAKGGRRILWEGAPAYPSIPAVLLSQQMEAVIDNIPNQFVRFALTSWRDYGAALKTTLEACQPSVQVARGIKEAGEIVDRIETILAAPLFQEVSDLTVFPVANQVLQKRAGYRDILRNYVQFELASRLGWIGGDDVYRAGQKNVAMLYEYWCFLQLAQIISRLCDEPLDQSSLLHIEADRLSLSLKQGKESILAGTIQRLGRQLDITLCYNRTFGRSGGSWTVEMRPDFTVRIEPRGPTSLTASAVYVHFDAKYRIDRLADIEESAVESQSEASPGMAKRADLLKMHAYRDAIRLSAGAYVLYPGDRKRTYSAYSELLPGLGAFPLKPQEVGEAVGAGELAAFLEDLVTHVAHQASEHERARYWAQQSYRSSQSRRRDAVAFLTRPPADTRVLLGYVKSDLHLEWIHRSRRYNLRADGRRGTITRSFLNCELLLLHGRGVSDDYELWRVEPGVETWSATDLELSGYPSPGGNLYYCVTLDRMVPVTGRALAGARVAEFLATQVPRALSGFPSVTTWKELCG